MSHIETESTKPSLAVLVNIAVALLVDTDELLSVPTRLRKERSYRYASCPGAKLYSAQAHFLLNLLSAAKISMEENL